jgi:hypothetical protein
MILCLSMHHIVDTPTSNGFDRAVVFVHADASRHCPSITNILYTSNDIILESLAQKDRKIPGYIALSKVPTASVLDVMK